MIRLTPDEIDHIATAVASKLAPLLATRAKAEAPASAPVPPTITHRLTVEQFAFIIERTAPHVREKIRLLRIPRADRDGPPYLIHPRALKLFGVSPELAATRLALWHRQQPSAAETPPAVQCDPVPRPGDANEIAASPGPANPSGGFHSK